LEIYEQVEGKTKTDIKVMMSMRIWSEFGSGQGPVAGSCEHGNEHADFTKGRKLLEYLSDHQLL
jgi:hypothetical protein